MNEREVSQRIVAERLVPIHRDKLTIAPAFERPSLYEQISPAGERTEILEIPFLTPVFCAELCSIAAQRGVFKPIADDGKFAADEMRIRTVASAIEEFLVAAAVEFIGPILWNTWGYSPTVFAPLFVTRYRSDGVAGIPIHHDRQSDVTFTVPLNSNFVGGGLFFPRQQVLAGLGSVGRAVVFPGRVTHPHCALPVTDGERYVLTFWTRHRDGAEYD
jgi:hypothetical protein